MNDNDFKEYVEFIRNVIKESFHSTPVDVTKCIKAMNKLSKMVYKDFISKVLTGIQFEDVNILIETGLELISRSLTIDSRLYLMNLSKMQDLLK